MVVVLVLHHAADSRSGCWYSGAVVLYVYHRSVHIARDCIFFNTFCIFYVAYLLCVCVCVCVCVLFSCVCVKLQIFTKNALILIIRRGWLLGRVRGWDSVFKIKKILFWGRGTHNLR